MQCTYLWPNSPDQFGQYYIVAVTSLTILIAAPGNLLTALVVIRNISLRNEPAYLLICSVCFADAIVAMVTQPLFVATVMLGSRYSCTIDNLFFAFAWLSSVSSTLGIVTITVDRYAYIVHPLHYQTIMTKARARYMICIVWTTAILFAALPILYHNRMILQTSVVGIMFIISVFMAVTYSKVYRQVVNSADIPPPTLNQQTKNVLKQKSQHQATKTVLLVCLAFFGCWYPWVIVSFLIALSDYVPSLAEYECQSVMITLHWIFLGLGYCNSSLNVFIYGRKNTVLQKAVTKFLVSKELPIISALLVGKKVDEKEPEIYKIEGTRMRAATTLSQMNTPLPVVCEKEGRTRSQTFISVLSF
ncbi:melanocyte-stimulating hormone receptor-like [Clytia hemisphaerica]|uniref:melanocyte-stimulating hormone receptor-like n=1 Tax=Clytia hemisphaerica TaxID=252671 RepID=UPI0034D3BE53